MLNRIQSATIKIDVSSLCIYHITPTSPSLETNSSESQAYPQSPAIPSNFKNPYGLLAHETLELTSQTSPEVLTIAHHSISTHPPSSHTRSHPSLSNNNIHARSTNFLTSTKPLTLLLLIPLKNHRHAQLQRASQLVSRQCHVLHHVVDV